VDRRGNVFVDVIVGINDTKIRNFDDLFRAFDVREPNEKVTVHIMREGRETVIEMALQEIE
jgi:S1-C subfamily serine protease